MSLVEDMAVVEKLLKVNDVLLNVLQMYKDKAVGGGASGKATTADDEKSRRPSMPIANLQLKHINNS